jgi:hypothetical protein
MRKITVRFAALGAIACLAAPALADWYPGDGHKMHYPQMPDPFGWDVEFNSFTGTPWQNSAILADDWTCSETGPVSDLHFWMSWWADDVGIIENVEVRIFDDANSKPGAAPVWTATIGNFSVVDPYGTGDQGFYVPPGFTWYPSNHQTFQQINIVDIDNPFIQEAGTTYWLGLYVTWTDGPQGPAGWKTTLDPYNAGGMYWDYIAVDWFPLTDPVGMPLDLAFVITPEAGSLPLLLLGLLGARRRR